MIYIVIGTKAQFIKMAPVMHLLQVNSEKYHLLDLSQHANLTSNILDAFGLKPGVTRLSEEGVAVTTYAHAIRWFLGGLSNVLLRKKTLRRRLFLNEGGVALLHGDTLSTLLGLYLSRSAGLKTALIEAGLSSDHLLDPFPEEWIRRHVGKKVDYLFPADYKSETWLRARNYRGQIINTRYNTGKDALYLIKSRQQSSDDREKTVSSYGTVTLHRLETLSSARRLRRAINHVLELSERLGPFKFYLHPPTEVALKKNRMMAELLGSENIEIFPLAPYPEFIEVLSRSRFILTDGGSIQEEAYYLGKPCLMLRNRTERSEGVGRNAVLATWCVAKDVEHLLGKEHESENVIGTSNLDASQKILDSLIEFRNGNRKQK